MGITFSTTPKALFSGLSKELNSSLDHGLNQSAEFMKSQFELVFDNKLSTENERDFGFEMFEPTTGAALRGRKTFPKDSNLQQQRAYEENADTLVDTGRLKESIAIEEDDTKTIKRRYVGASVPYIETTEDGGTITVDGESFDVPARPFQHITNEEQQNIENLILKSIREGI